MSEWENVLELDSDRRLLSGSEESLCRAVGRGADLRIYTEFHHNEHIDTESKNKEKIQEVTEFGVTYLFEDRWSAGIIQVRQPISLPDSFGDRPSMSFFLYNQDGQQAIARPHLDGEMAEMNIGPSPLRGHGKMPKYHEIDNWDAQTNAPSSNFVYDFEVFKYFVRDDWQEVLSHGSNGEFISGSVETLADAFSEGREVKVGIRDLCNDLTDESSKAMAHEVFVKLNSCYYYTEQKLFIAGTYPLVRVGPSMPLSYRSNGWDMSWLMLKTDGSAALRSCNPYTLKFTDSNANYALRWFVR